MSGFWKTGVEYHFLGLHIALESLIRDAIFATAAILSLILTKKEYREANQFSWEPILEVGKLFFGIFVTIVPFWKCCAQVPPVLLLRWLLW